MGGKSCVIKDQLAEHKSQIVDLQAPCVALGITKGYETCNKRLDAGADPVGRNFQQHDAGIGQTNRYCKQVDCLWPKQVNRCDSRQDGDTLKRDLGTGTYHRRYGGKT